MRKKLFKWSSTILLIIMIIVTMSNTVFAFSPSNIDGSNTNMSEASNKIEEVGNALVSILQTVGIVLSVVILIVLGIKYMMGSASEKAEYKKTMVPYLIGALLIFAASVLANVVYQFFSHV